MIITGLSFEEGQELKVRVKPGDDCCTFSINIGHDAENIALHFNPRFCYGVDNDTIVFNSMSGGCWAEEERDGHFCFQRSDESKVYINFNHEQFYIKLPGGHMVNFPNRFGEVKYDYFCVWGEAKVVGIKLK